MRIEKEKVIERIRESKEFGLKYSQIAKFIEIAPTTLYLFLSNKATLSKEKQIKALVYVENYIEEVKKQLATIQKRGVI